MGNDVLVARSDSGFGRIFTFEFSTTLKSGALSLTMPTVPAALLLTTDAVMGTLMTFAETGWTTTPGNALQSSSETGEDRSVLIDTSSQRRDCNESHSSAVISVISCVLPSPYKYAHYSTNTMFKKWSTLSALISIKVDPRGWVRMSTSPQWVVQCCSVVTYVSTTLQSTG